METTNDKATPTYKKYAKYVGQLMWVKHSHYNYEKACYINYHVMCMITGMRQHWSNRWQYEIMELENTENTEAGRIYYRVASRFSNYLKDGL